MLCTCCVCKTGFEDPSVSEIPEGMVPVCPACDADPAKIKDFGLNLAVAQWVGENVETREVDGQTQFRLRDP